MEFSRKRSFYSVKFTVKNCETNFHKNFFCDAKFLVKIESFKAKLKKKGQKLLILKNKLNFLIFSGNLENCPIFL
jgi:hypothetical protein